MLVGKLPPLTLFKRLLMLFISEVTGPITLVIFPLVTEFTKDIGLLIVPNTSC